MGQCPHAVQLQLEYQKGHDNMVADILSWVTTQLDSETVKSILKLVGILWNRTFVEVVDKLSPTTVDFIV